MQFQGFCADPQPFLLQAGVFVLPSRFEGMPNALLEAMAAGLAVVVTDASPGPLEVVEEGVSGLVVPSDDPYALAEALDRLVVDPELRGAWVLRRETACASWIGQWSVRSGSLWWINHDSAAVAGVCTHASGSF